MKRMCRARAGTRAPEGRFGLPVVLGNICWLLGAVLLLLAWTRMIKRWKRNMDVSDDAEYVATLATLSEASARHFNPYTDIDWKAPEFSVTKNDPRWVLPTTDPLGNHPWYRAQPLEKRIAIGMWRQANMAKVGMQFEGILVRGLMHYTFWVPNGSPEYRYCVHESIEECSHSLMFQEVVNRIGVDVPGMPRWLRLLSPIVPFYAGPLPNAFFFGVLAGEVPFDHLQTNLLREPEPRSMHPIMENLIAIHVAEEARHISFAHEYLHKRVPHMPRRNRFLLSLFVPVVMRMLGQAMVVPSRRFFRQFDIPRSVRTELFSHAPDSGQPLRDMYADIRMLCHDLGLMNPVALLMWRICRINGRPSRYRSEPQRAHLPSPATAA
jgi:P-aminobenzoate N-oxygenase AurF